VFELVRPSPSTTPQELANLAKQYVSLGADALAVRTDSDDTSTGVLPAVQFSVFDCTSTLTIHSGLFLCKHAWAEA
jgi:hypothetical protein